MSLSLEVALQCFYGDVTLSKHVGLNKLVTTYFLSDLSVKACQSSDPSLADLLTHWHGLLTHSSSRTHTVLAYNSLGTVTHVKHNPI